MLGGIPVSAHSSVTMYFFAQRGAAPLSARPSARKELMSGGEGAGWVVLLPLTIETRRGRGSKQVTQERAGTDLRSSPQTVSR